MDKIKITRLSFGLMLVGLGIFCLSIISWAGLGIAGYHFASTRIFQAGAMLMIVLTIIGGIIHYFDERQKRRY